MDNFFRRLKIYGIGFGIGLICVFLFFRNRGCNWLPENRVKSSFIERVIVVHEEEMPAFKALALNEKQLNDLIQNSSISFSESKKKGEPKAVGIGKSEQLLKITKEIGYIDYSKSTFDSEKSSHCWVIEKPSAAFSMQTTWYKEKITLKSVEIANSEEIPSN